MVRPRYLAPPTPVRCQAVEPANDGKGTTRIHTVGQSQPLWTGGETGAPRSVDLSPLCPGLVTWTYVLPGAEAGTTASESVYHRHIQTAQLCLLVQLKGKLPAPWRASQGHSHSRCWLPLPENEASRLRKCETEFPLNQPSFSVSPAPQHHSPALLPPAGPSLPDLISPTEIVWVLTAQDNWKCL